MNYYLKEKQKELLKRYPNPSDRNLYEYNHMQFRKGNPFIHAIVADNKDPECLGRIRVQMDLVAPGCVSPWYHMSGQWKSSKNGLWQLPELGTQVIVCFPENDYVHGIVLGCIYDQKHLPPELSTEKPNQSYLWQTKNHRIEIIDEDGKEGIYIETAKGKMRCSITKDKGIEIINELGDINIKCKKLIIKTEENLETVSQKKTTFTCKDAMSIKTKKNTGITGDKEIKLKGKNIKLSGSKGVTAEGKQIAVEGNQVVGMDTHIMVVPAGTSTANVPLPHPFIGKLKDGLSDNVKIKDKKCATKDSVAKHDDSTHMQLPGTIKFQKNPKKEGKVTGGTSSKVKINGKEAAVIGSQVTTCNDVGMQNNSTVIAPGASIPMPVIINPANTKDWEREQEEDKKEPKFSGVKWSVTSAEEGEEAELTASVQDIEDGNMVTLQVFPEGKGPEDSVPLARFPLTVEGGSVSAKWLYRADSSEMPPDNNPKFIFTAHCAWCNFEKSSNSLQVKLVRPEIKKAEWQDVDGSSTDKGLVGQTLKLYAQTKDVQGAVTFNIFDDKGKQVASLGADIENDQACVEWTYHYNGEKLDAKPKFKFEVSGNRCKRVESGEVEISGKIRIYLQTNIDYETYGFDAELIKNDDEDNIEELTFDSGKIEKEDLIPANYTLSFLQNETSIDSYTGEIGEPVCVYSYMYKNVIAQKINLSFEKNIIVFINKNEKGVSQ